MFFFSPTLILLAVQLRDGRFCTAALNSRLPSRGCFSLSLTVLTVFIRKHIDPTLLGLITFEKSTNSIITLSKRLRCAMLDDQTNWVRYSLCRQVYCVTLKNQKVELEISAYVASVEPGDKRTILWLVLWFFTTDSKGRVPSLLENCRAFAKLWGNTVAGSHIARHFSTIELVKIGEVLTKLFFTNIRDEF